MRRIGKTKKGSWLFLAVALAVGAVTLGSCLKDGENQVYQVSAVRALNAVPGSESLDVFLDQNKLNFDNEVTGQEEEFAYTDTLPYKNAWPNSRLVRVFDPADYPSADPLVQKTVNFTPGKFYSLYVVGYDDIELVSSEDDLSAPAEGKAKIRFIHLSPDAPALDFELNGAGEPVVINDKAFKEISDFTAVDSGESYTVTFSEHGTGDTLHTFEFVPESGMIYTIWTKGLLGNTGDTALDFNHGIIIH